MLTFLEVITANMSGNYNYKHFWKLNLLTFLEVIIANISGHTYKTSLKADKEVGFFLEPHLVSRFFDGIHATAGMA